LSFNTAKNLNITGVSEEKVVKIALKDKKFKKKVNYRKI